MNEKLLMVLFRAGSAWLHFKNSGEIAALQTAFDDLVKEANTSILAPKADGTPWTLDDFDALCREHVDLAAAMRANLAVDPQG